MPHQACKPTEFPSGIALLAFRERYFNLFDFTNSPICGKVRVGLFFRQNTNSTP